jgi:hypothetical protein
VLTFVTELLRFAVLLAALGAPLWIVAWRYGQVRTMRKFGYGASGVALASALLAVISRRQMLQCEAVGYPNCFDYGTTGFQTLMVFVFAVMAWWSAYSIWRG